MRAGKSKKSTDSAEDTKAKTYNTDDRRKAAAGMCFGDLALGPRLLGGRMASDFKGKTFGCWCGAGKPDRAHIMGDASSFQK